MAEVKGGDKLAIALAKISVNLSEAGTLKVGFLAGARYPDGTPVAMVAAIHNYGAPRANIPPRPFFSDMIAKKSREWPAAISALLVTHDYDTRAVLTLTGEAIRGQLQQSIRDTNSPPLAPATIRRKGFDKPLVDTGHMINSVGYVVS